MGVGEHVGLPRELQPKTFEDQLLVGAAVPQLQLVGASPCHDRLIRLMSNHPRASSVYRSCVVQSRKAPKTGGQRRSSRTKLAVSTSSSRLIAKVVVPVARPASRSSQARQRTPVRTPSSSGRLLRAVIQVMWPLQPAQQRVVRTTSPVALSLTIRMFIAVPPRRAAASCPVRAVVDQHCVHGLEREHGVDVAQAVAPPAGMIRNHRSEARRHSRTAGTECVRRRSPVPRRAPAHGETTRDRQGTCAARAARGARASPAARRTAQARPAGLPCASSRA